MPLRTRRCPRPSGTPSRRVPSPPTALRRWRRGRSPPPGRCAYRGARHRDRPRPPRPSPRRCVSLPARRVRACPRRSPPASPPPPERPAAYRPRPALVRSSRRSAFPARLPCPVPVVGEDAGRDVTRFGKRALLRELVPLVELLLDALLELADGVLVDDPFSREQLLESLHRILVRHVVLEYLLRDVFRRVVSRVPAPAKGDRFNERGTVATPGPLDR